MSVPGYPNLRYIGGAASKPAEQHVSPTLLEKLQQVAQRLGVTIDIFSGSGGPSVRGGGFAGDPHSRNIAVDASINGTPLGNYPGAVTALHSVGVRSGATDFTYQGKPDPAHADLLSFPGSGGGGVNTPGVNSPDDFFVAVLQALHVPVNTANLNSLKGQAVVEGTSAAYNPLATSQHEQGSTSFNSAGVQNYPNAATGVAATAATIKQYPNLLAALKSGSGYQVGGNGIIGDLAKWESGNSSNPYGRGVYAQRVIQQAKNPSSKPAGFWHDPVASGAVDAVTAIPDFIGKLTNPSYILRGLQILGGAALLGAGLVLLARQVALAADLPAPSGLAAAAAVA